MSSPRLLSSAFVARLPSGVSAPEEPEARARLEEALKAAVAASQTAWPDVQMDEEVFVHYMATRAPTPDAAGIAALKSTDLWLACACASGNTRALTAFEQRFLTDIPSYVGQIDRSRAFVDEVRQQLSEKLLVQHGSDPRKITDYTGKGPLGGWLRVGAVRLALNLKRSQKPMPLVNDPDRSEIQETKLASHQPDPELDYLKLRYRTELREAFALTLASLDGDARAVLKMHYLDGLNIDEIGLSYKVHRSTVARWLSQAREKILDETRRILASRMQIGRAEAESVIHLVHSQLDVSIYRYLGGKAASTGHDLDEDGGAEDDEEASNPGDAGEAG